MNNALEVVESRSPSPILTIENVRNESSRVADITNQLNKLKAKLLKAKMLKSNSVAKLQKEYDDLSLELEMDRQEMDKQEKKRQFVSHNFGNRFTHAENKSNKLKRKSEKEEDKDIMELLREEKNSKSGDQVKHMVNKICRDGGYKDDLEYIEERAEHFASKDNRNNKKDIDYKILL
ncbi:hypothetical protein K502DRAFT_124304 [Neoconidiobolus thromboides FSU 785]|nr:hypothetical protein K502DRAFT_124304 [Neoconidiobolus thromboides FSU 785]